MNDSKSAATGQKTAVKKVFISYAHGVKLYNEWVKKLSTDLMTKYGIDVVLDQWELRPGKELDHYMERVVSDPSIDYVLMLCDKKYMTKADDREGGVGKETIIISEEVYSNIDNTKFIPIVVEKDENGKAFLPVYLKSRFWIDFSSPESYSENLEILARNILGKNKDEKPKLGKVPDFKKEIIVDIETKTKLSNISDELLRRIEESILEYEVYEEKGYKVIIEEIEKSIAIRDTFLRNLVYCIKNDKIDSDEIISFFEKVNDISNEYKFSNGVSNDSQNDNISFLTTELFISTVTLLLKYNKEKIAYDLLSNSYFTLFSRSRGKEHVFFPTFRKYCRSLDSKNVVEKLNRISLQSDMLFDRVSGEFFSQREFFDADLMLCYLSEILLNDKDVSTWRKWWFPCTYIYYERYQDYPDIMKRLKSIRACQKYYALFGVNSVNEMKEKFAKANEYAKTHYKVRRYSSDWFNEVPYLDEIIDINEIGSIS